MIVEEGPLTADERAHLKALAPPLLAGQGWGFWGLANGIALAFIAALLWIAVPDGEPYGLRQGLVVPLGVTWLGLNGFYLWMRHHTRGLRRDVSAPRKQTIQGPCQGVSAQGNALVYTVGGQGWRVYPALPLDQGFIAGLCRIEDAATLTDTPIRIERTASGDRLLAVRHPALDGAASLRIDPTLDAADVRRLHRRANRTAALVALGVGGAGMLLAMASGHAPWIWLLPMAALAVLTRYSMRPAQWLGWAEARGPVTETVHASWRTRQVRRHGHWVRVAGRLFPVARPLPLGARVRLRARWRHDGFPGETTEVEPLPPADR